MVCSCVARVVLRFRCVLRLLQQPLLTCRIGKLCVRKDLVAVKTLLSVSVTRRMVELKSLLRKCLVSACCVRSLPSAICRFLSWTVRSCIRLLGLMMLSTGVCLVLSSAAQNSD